MNCLKATNYLKVQNETLAAELLVANKKLFSTRRTRLFVNHCQQEAFRNKKKKIVLMN
jgi:hypothetical protein